MVFSVVRERAVRWAVVKTSVKLMVLWDPTPCCLINEYWGFGVTYQRFQDRKYELNWYILAFVIMQCKQKCSWTATRCLVQVLYYSAVSYTVILRSYVVVSFGTGNCSRDDLSRSRCSYKRNSRMRRVVTNYFNQDLKIYKSRTKCARKWHFKKEGLHREL